MERPELEERLSNLQLEVERLWRKAEANVPPVEHRLAAMADQYAEYLKRWASTVERHTHAVAQLESYAREWKDASSRVRQETAARLHELESTIEREWETLRRMHEEPVRELREQAESLAQVSLTVANASQTGLDRAEARFATFENEVHLRLSELTRELQTAITEMKARIDRQQGRLDTPAQWSLDDVTRLHGQLRESARTVGDAPQTIEHSAVPRPRELPGGGPVDEPVTQNRARRLADQALAPSQRMPRTWAAMVVAVGAIAIVATVYLVRMQGQLTAADERARALELKADAAVTDAARQSQEARRQADEQINLARWGPVRRRLPTSSRRPIWSGTTCGATTVRRARRCSAGRAASS